MGNEETKSPHHHHTLKALLLSPSLSFSLVGRDGKEARREEQRGEGVRVRRFLESPHARRSRRNREASPFYRTKEEENSLSLFFSVARAKETKKTPPTPNTLSLSFSFTLSLSLQTPRGLIEKQRKRKASRGGGGREIRTKSEKTTRKKKGKKRKEKREKFSPSTQFSTFPLFKT